MGKNQFSFKMFILVLIPLIVSVLINRLTIIASIYDKPSVRNTADAMLNIWRYACIVYWYWVGKKFGILSSGKKKSFILGNTLWGIGFIFYIIIFFFVDEANRVNFNKIIPWLSQLAEGYSLGFIKWSSLIVSPLKKSVDFRIVVLISYVIMLVFFTLGFSRGKRRKLI